MRTTRFLPGLIPALVLPILVVLPAAAVRAEGPVPAPSASPMRALPTPPTVSPELARLMSAPPRPFWNAHPKNADEWRALVAQVADEARPLLADCLKRLEVASTPGELGGVPVFTLSPKTVPPKHEGRVLLHLHGGGYVLNPGESGTLEGVLMAGLGGFKVVSADYRMPPDHPYPAALDDALAVYRALPAEYGPERIAVFGSSTGGGLALALTLRARAEGLPLPDNKDALTSLEAVKRERLGTADCGESGEYFA